jgi:hypothetical protein
MAVLEPFDPDACRERLSDTLQQLRFLADDYGMALVKRPVAWHNVYVTIRPASFVGSRICVHVEYTDRDRLLLLRLELIRPIALRWLRRTRDVVSLWYRYRSRRDNRGKVDDDIDREVFAGVDWSQESDVAPRIAAAVLASEEWTLSLASELFREELVALLSHGHLDARFIRFWIGI